MPIVSFSILLGGISFWFLKAPSLRFGFGFVYSLFSFCTVYLLLFFSRPVKFSQTFIASTAILITLFCLYFGRDFRSLSQFGLFPAKYLSIKVKTEIINNGQIYVPLETFVPETGKVEPIIFGVTEVYDQCWDAPLPCTYGNKANLVFRGKNLEDGFKTLP